MDWISAWSINIRDAKYYAKKVTQKYAYESQINSGFRI